MPLRKLTIFTDSYPYGSAEPFLRNELDYLSLAFDEIKIIPLNYGTSRETRSVPHNVSYTTPIMNNSKAKDELLIKGVLNSSPFCAYVKDLFTSGAYRSGKKNWSWGIGLLMARTILANKEVKRVLKDQSYDTFYFYWGIRASFIIPLLSKSLNKKIAIRFHGSDTYEETNGGYIPLRKRQLERVDRAYFCSEYGKSYVESKYPFVKNVSEISRLGVHEQGLSPRSTDDIFRILTISNMVPLKRLDLLASALLNVKAKVSWVHIGDGETAEKVKSIAAQLPSNVTAQFLGKMPNKEVITYLTNNPVDLFINVSSSEGVPVSIMEALSMGIPVLATAVGGTPEIVDSEVGELLPSDISAEALAAAIERIAQRVCEKNLRDSAKKRWSERCNAAALYQQFSQSILNI